MKLSYACFVALTLALAGCKASVSTVIEERNDDTPTDNSNNGSRNGSGNGNSNNNANSNNNNSGAECVDGAMEPCGSDVGQCMAGERTCTDGLWGACIGEVAPVTETCNGLDDNCDGTPDEGCPCTGDETRACGTDVGECQAGTQTCNAGAWGDCMGAVDPVLELCNDLDDNCDGTDDDGCDDDGDGYCDAAIMVMGSPGICPNGGNDCDDSVATGATVNPGATEVCTDGIDNDCLGGADRADLASCAPPSLNIDRGEAIDLNHSNTIVLTADFDFEDPGFGTPSEWTREWEIVSVAGGCVASDATLQDGVEFASLTRVTFVPPSSVGTLGCVFTVRATVAGVAFDQIDIRVVNDRPMISSIDEAVFDGASWRMQVRVNTSRSVTARWQLPEADVPVIFDWTGAGASVLGCSSSSCENSVGAQPFFSTQTINAPSTTGSVIINVSVRDSFEAVSDTVPLIIEFIDCVWVADTGTAGTGLTPSSPLNDLDAAITAAFSASPPDDVCIVGGGTLAKDGTPLPTSPSSTPSIFAGFDSTGAVTANRPTITVGTPDGLTFSAGYSGTIAGVTLESTYSASLPPAVVTVRDSSPTLIDTDVVVPTADGSTGIDINASGTANPEIIGGDIRPESSGMAPTNTTGIRVRESSGEAAPILSPEQVDIRGVEGTIARAIWLEEGTTATVSNTSLIFAGGNVTTAVAIDVDGGASSTSAVIADNASIRTFGGSVTETSVIIRLSNTNRVMIRGNTLQGPFSEISGFNAAIADGSLDRQGNLVPGNSTLLTIEDNDEIGLGGPFSIDCSGTGETMDVSSAIFLAGTSNATVRNNQNIRGGSGSAHWSPAGRVYPPLNVGLWTIDADGVTVTDNRILSGSLSDFPGCPAVPASPLVVALRDGLPSNSLATPAVEASGESDGLILERNGIVCVRDAEGAGAGFSSDCAALELNSSPSALSRTVEVTNNYITSTRGTLLMGLRMENGSGVSLTNNTIEVDYVIGLFGPATPPPNGSLVKRAVYLINIDDNGIDFVNNLIVSAVDPDWDGTRIGILEETMSTGSSVGVFAHNLVHVESDATVPMPVDFVLVDSAGSNDIDGSAALNSLTGATNVENNLAANPLLNGSVFGEDKPDSRLNSGSAAIDAGRSAGAPSVDLYGNPRSDGAIDIGHHEVQ